MNTPMRDVIEWISSLTVFQFVVLWGTATYVGSFLAAFTVDAVRALRGWINSGDDGHA